MDRSFLSQPQVIAASRNFVCIRLATYENAQEIEVLGKIFRGGSGQVENTTFALLSPDGAVPLVRSGRGPDWAFSDATHMAQVMQSIAAHYEVVPHGRPQVLPEVSDLRLALNIAACDQLPLLVVVGRDSASRRPQRDRLAQLLWQPNWRGRAIVCQAGFAEVRPWLRQDQPGLVVLQPGNYGVDGQLLAWVESGASDWEQRLERGLQRYRRSRLSQREHIRQGRGQGIYWQTKVPSTDPHR